MKPSQAIFPVIDAHEWGRDLHKKGLGFNQEFSLKLFDTFFSMSHFWSKLNIDRWRFVPYCSDFDPFLRFSYDFTSEFVENLFTFLKPKLATVVYLARNETIMK